MTHLQKAPRKPWFYDEKQGNTFISLFGDEIEQRIAKCIFIEGLTNEETALEIGYCTCSIERKRKSMLKIVLKMLIELRTPKKPNIHGFREGREINTISFTCPMCNEHIGRDRYCKHCGQALDWSDTE